MAIGAVYLAADSIDYKLPRDYSHNYDIFQHFTPNTPAKTNGTHTNGNDTAAKKLLNGDARSMNGLNHTTTNGNSTAKTNVKILTNGTQPKNGLKQNSTPNAILIREWIDSIGWMEGDWEINYI